MLFNQRTEWSDTSSVLHDENELRSINATAEDATSAMLRALDGELAAKLTNADDERCRIACATQLRSGPPMEFDLRLDESLDQAKRFLNSSPQSGVIQIRQISIVAKRLRRVARGMVRVILEDAVDVEELTGAVLDVGDAWLLERLIKTIQEIRTAPKDFSFPLALAALNERAAGNRIAPLHSIDGIASDTYLNEEQFRCIEHSFKSAVSVIVGPPGTGKTCTLAEIAVKHSLSEQRVLILGPSNAATDVLLRACFGRLDELEKRKDGWIVRLGKNPTQALRDEIGDKVLPASIGFRMAVSAVSEARKKLGEQSVPASVDAMLPASPREELVSLKTAEAIKRAKIVACPSSQLYLHRELLQGKFDTVIIDEASMWLTPVIWLAAGYARQRVIIAGDPCQLSAPVESKSDTYLKRDIFQRHGISISDQSCTSVPSVLLREQYRMAPTICGLVSDSFYDGLLRSAPSVRKREAFVWSDHPSLGAVIAIDSTELSGDFSKTFGARANIAHADLAEIMTRQAFTSLRLAGVAEPTALVLSPYRNQVAHLRCLFEKIEGVDVRTVHRSQGSEADFVVFTIDDSPDALSPFFNRKGRGSDGLRLLNVAMSRAKRALVVICPLKAMLATHKLHHEVHSVLKRLEDEAVLLSGHELLRDFAIAQHDAALVAA